MGASFKDMFDGGGFGRAGQRFEGGPLSDFLNDIGVKPYGYYDRMKAVRPQMRPAGLLGGGGSAAAGGMGAARSPDSYDPRGADFQERSYSQPFQGRLPAGPRLPGPQGEMAALDEAVMPRDMTSGTPSFRNRMQDLGSQLSEIGAVQPMETEQPAAYRPDPAMVAGAYKEHPSAPGYGQAFLAAINQLPPNERDMVMGSEDAMYSLFQRFMQTGSIR